LFDGRLLALYFVASSVFEDPMNRREVTVGECAELDAYLRRHNLGKGNVASARALEMERRATAAGKDESALWRGNCSVVISLALFSFFLIFGEDFPVFEFILLNPDLIGLACIGANVR
jgi:hypothetical protein